MEQSEIISGSIAIAEFLEWDKETVLPNHYTVTGEWIKFDFIDMTAYRPSEMRFHKDWNWLMPVKIKFRDLTFGLPQSEKKHAEWMDCISWYLFCANTPENLFGRISEAIKWYNTTKQ